MSSMSSSRRCRTVQFSEFSELYVVPRPRSDAKAYSSGDIKRFKRDLNEAINAAEGMERLLATKTAEEITQEDLYECIGVELFLTKGLAKHAAARKRAHIHAIVDGQHNFKEEELSILSEVSSRWARERALNTAIKYSGF